MSVYDPIHGCRGSFRPCTEPAPYHVFPRRKQVAVNSNLAGAKSAGTELFNTSEKVFEDIKANPGEKAFTFMHTVPFEGSVGLVNLLTTTRVQRKGFDTTLVLSGPE